MEKYTIQVYHHSLSVENEDTWVDLGSLEIHPDITRELIELGVVEVRQGQIPSYQIVKIQKIMRLYSNLGVNLSGAAIIFDLLDKIEKMQTNIEYLKRR